MVALGIKISKWASVPADVVELVNTTRGEAKSVVDAINALTPRKQGLDPGKIDLAIKDMQAQRVTTPLSFHVMYFKERSSELIQFRQFDEFSVFISTEEVGYLKVEHFGEDMQGVRTEVVEECISESLRAIALQCDAGEDDKDGAIISTFA
eukprot:9007995-Pyramimonas_sp.AAC.1